MPNHTPPPNPERDALVRQIAAEVYNVWIFASAADKFTAAAEYIVRRDEDRERARRIADMERAETARIKGDVK